MDVTSMPADPLPTFMAQPHLIGRNLTEVVLELDSRPCPVRLPTYFFYSFEKNMRCAYVLPTVIKYWWTSWAAVALYVTAVVLGRKLMDVRGKPFDLRRPLIAWNASLAVFSIIGALRTSALFVLVWEKGLYYALLHNG
jgi:hypothetical protein